MSDEIKKEEHKGNDIPSRRAKFSTSGASIAAILRTEDSERGLLVPPAGKQDVPRNRTESGRANMVADSSLRTQPPSQDS